MHTLKLVLIAGLGGAFGAGLRMAVSLAALAVLGPQFPWGTLAVNVIGAAAMGALAARAGHDGLAMAFWGAGVLGGFTTFSAFSLEMLRMLERGALLQASAYGAASVVLSVGAAGTGYALARAAP